MKKVMKDMADGKLAWGYEEESKLHTTVHKAWCSLEPAYPSWSC